MKSNARDEILSRLRRGARRPVPPRPTLPPMMELSLDLNGLISRFSENLTVHGGAFHHTSGREALLKTLGEILRAEGVKRAVCSSDEVVAPLDLPKWGTESGLALELAVSTKDPQAYRESVFLADAGITGGDLAVAESGTVVLFHGKDQARLISLAPPLHIVIIPAGRVVPTYERVIEAVYAQETPPSQITFITGPSASSDIRATPFRGMHGPQKVVAIVLTTLTFGQEH